MEILSDSRDYWQKRRAEMRARVLADPQFAQHMPLTTTVDFMDEWNEELRGTGVQ